MFVFLSILMLVYSKTLTSHDTLTFFFVFYTLLVFSLHLTKILIYWCVVCPSPSSCLRLSSLVRSLAARVCRWWCRRRANCTRNTGSRWRTRWARWCTRWSRALGVVSSIYDLHNPAPQFGNARPRGEGPHEAGLATAAGRVERRGRRVNWWMAYYRVTWHHGCCRVFEWRWDVGLPLFARLSLLRWWWR